MPEILHDGVIWKMDEKHKTDKTQQLPFRALLKTTQPESRFCENLSWDFLFRQGLVLLDDLLRTVLHYLASEPAEAGAGWKHRRIQEAKLRYKL